MAAHQFVPLEFPASHFVTNQLEQAQLSVQSLPYRQVSTVDQNSIKTIGLHPQGHRLGTSSQTMQLPADAVDASIEIVIDSDTALGFASFSDGSMDGVLWITPSTAVRLVDSVPVAGIQFADQAVLVALELAAETRIAKFDQFGYLIQSISLPGEVYFEVQASSDGLLLLGSEDDVPVLTHIDKDLAVSTVELQMPTNAAFAVPVGSYRHSEGWEYVGSAIDNWGETGIVRWDQYGNVRPSLFLEGYSASKAVGHVILVESEDGPALVFLDESIARRFQVEINIPIVASEIALFQGLGLTQITITDIWEQNDEFYMGIVAIDADDQLVHGLLVSTTFTLPSPWRNPTIAADVNRSGNVTPMDALIVINELNRTGPRTLTLSDLTNRNLGDVNGDGVLAPMDALVVINYLNRQQANHGQGESHMRNHGQIGGFVEFDEYMRRRSIFLLRLDES